MYILMLPLRARVSLKDLFHCAFLAVGAALFFLAVLDATFTLYVALNPIHSDAQLGESYRKWCVDFSTLECRQLLASEAVSIAYLVGFGVISIWMTWVLVTFVKIKLQIPRWKSALAFITQLIFYNLFLHPLLMELGLHFSEKSR